jgi:hypothetical protein
MKRPLSLAIATIALLFSVTIASATSVKPGDVISGENAGVVADLVSPGNYALVRQGMEMRIVPTTDYDWPPPYKSSTEQYSSQVSLGPHGELQNYRAGLPFLVIDPNDPKVAQKIMWNFEFGPSYTDDLDSQDDEIASYAPGHSQPWSVYPVGHLAVYRNVGREEVAPITSDNDGGSGIMQRVALGAIIVPIEPPFWQLPWDYMVRYRYSDPQREDLVWTGLSTWGWWGEEHRGMGPTSYLVGTSFFGNLDMDSLFGFAGKLADFDFKYLGDKDVLAVVHASSVPARSCAADGGRTICPEDWELRHVHVIEADARRQGKFGDIPPIAKRILYIDSQGWFITASDQFDHAGKLWKTLALFNTVRDREYPDSKAAVYSFKRLFTTAMVDEDVQDGYSTILFSPSPNGPRHDTWFINQGVVSPHFIIPARFTSHRSYFY